MSLARVHYGHKQFNRSVYYYDLIDRDSEAWLTALFEASWAYYRRGDFEKALGNRVRLDQDSVLFTLDNSYGYLKLEGLVAGTDTLVVEAPLAPDLAALRDWLVEEARSLGSASACPWC